MAADTAKTWIGFDLGGTKMMAHVFDDEFHPIGRERRKTRGNDAEKDGLDRVIDTIKTAIEDAEVSAETVQAIGIGCPGPIDFDSGKMVDPPNLSWESYDVKNRLQEEFGCPVMVINDVDAGVYGEYCFGAAKKARCAIGVFPGTGIGGGCVYRDEIFAGGGRSCLEIGHVQVMPNGPQCGCGQRGCLESVASRLAISAQLAKAAYRGEAPTILKLAGTDVAQMRSKIIAEAIDNGEKVVEDIVREAARWIGIAIAGVINIMAPDVVILGGGLVEAMPKLFTGQVTKSAKKRVMPAYADTFKVVAAELGDDAVTMGSAAWARHSIEASARPAVALTSAGK